MIKVTNTAGQVERINPKYIIKYLPHNTGSIIDLQGEPRTYVNETPEQIDALLGLLELDAPKEFRLEVGKTYRNRLGEEVTISNYDGHPNYPFDSTNGFNFTPQGRYSTLIEYDFDLIEEVI